MATRYNGKSIDFDPNDWEGMLALMDRASDFNQMYSGTNENSEMITISVNPYNITVETFQTNSWIRTNIYHRDFTVEEMYSH